MFRSSPRRANRSLTARVIELLLVLAASAPAAAQAGHEAWSYNLGVYEINIRNVTREGTFAAAETHLDRLEAPGGGIIRLTSKRPGSTGFGPMPWTSCRWTSGRRLRPPAATDVRITLFDVSGRKLETLVSERQSAGPHTLNVDVSRLPAGTYFVHLDAGAWADRVQLAVVR